MTTRRLAVLLVTLLLLTACGGSDDEAGGAGASSAPAVAASPSEVSSATTSETGSEATSEAGGEVIGASDVELGTVLVDAEGKTLYAFDNDTDDTPTCTGDCEANWPPVGGDATAGDGVDGSLLGSSQRDDGSSQATYDGQPLYRFAGDQAAGDTNGQGVGGIWWAMGADGKKITDKAAASDDDGGY